MCRGTELDFYDNGRAGEKDVTDSNQAGQNNLYPFIPTRTTPQLRPRP